MAKTAFSFDRSSTYAAVRRLERCAPKPWFSLYFMMAFMRFYVRHECCEWFVFWSALRATIWRMKHRVYMESSVISYLAARPSADAITATRQHFSFQLWQKRGVIDLLISDAVLAEIKLGNAEFAMHRLSYSDAMPVLELPERTDEVATYLLRAKAIPAKAYTDAVHIAIAALHDIEFIASWNFRHIAGALPRRNIERALAALGVSVPVIATPEEILESLK